MHLTQLEEFQRSAIARKILPELISEPIPKKTGELVQKVVGKNFEEEVLKNDKDVVIQFFSDYCDHCTKMKKRFNKVAEKFAVDPTIQFMRMSSSLNHIDVESYKVQ